MSLVANSRYKLIHDAPPLLAPRRARAKAGGAASAWPALLDWQTPVKDDASFVLLLTGAAGGGKSWLAANKLHHYCLDHHGTMALALRKTRESMRNSTVLFLWRKI